MDSVNNSSTLYDTSIGQLFKQNAAPLLQRRLNFVPAKQPDLHIDILKSKYKPLNSQQKQVNKTQDAKAEKKSDQVKDGEDLQPARYELFPESKALENLEWHKIVKIGSGLSNLGNTCFLNSVLQCLTYTPPLANFSLEKEHSKTCRVTGWCMFCVLEKHITKALSASGSSISPSQIVTNLKCIAKHFRFGRQEDSHEFLRYVVEGLQRSCLYGLDKKIDPRIAETTLVHRIFGGYLQSQVKCLKCNYKSNTFDPLLDLCLEIKQCSSLEKALQHFTAVETLDKANKYKCPRCKQLVQAHKQFTVKVAPNILTIQLKRFHYSLMGMFGGGSGKIHTKVNFEEKLDLTPFMSQKPSSPVMYSLYGVIVHSGESTRSGHYYAFVKSASGVWYCMNDSSVSQVSVSKVLAQQAYMLFYAKVAPTERIPKSISTAKASTTNEETNGVVANGHTEKKLKSNENNQAQMNGNGIANGKRKLDSMQKQESPINGAPNGNLANGKHANGNVPNGKNKNIPNGFHNGPLSQMNGKNLANGHPEKNEQHPAKKLKVEHEPASNGIPNGKQQKQEQAPIKVQKTEQQPPEKPKPVVFNFGIDSDEPPLFAEKKPKKNTQNTPANGETKPKLTASNDNITNANTKQNNKPQPSQPVANGNSHEKPQTSSSNGKAKEETNSFFSKIANGPIENAGQPKKRKANADDGITNENPVVLTNAQKKTETFFVSEISTRKDTQLGKEVGHWDEEDEQTKVSLQIQRELFEKEAQEQRSKERDWWDAEYDKGRMKKVKRNRVDIFAQKENPFQTKKPVRFSIGKKLFKKVKKKKGMRRPLSRR